MKHQQATQDLIQNADTAAALMNPMRATILEHLREPNSAAGLSRILNIPRQQLNYHLKELEKKKLIELVAEKRKGNCTERIMQATARSYLVVLNTAQQEQIPAQEVQDRFSSTYLLSAASQVMQDVAFMQGDATRKKKKLATFTLQTAVRFASPEELHAFTETLAATISKLAAKYQNNKAQEGRSYSFTLLSHPTLQKSK